MSSSPTGPGVVPDRPTGTLRITLQGSTFSSGLTPTVVVSGYRINANWGTQDIPVWAGPNRVEAHAQWMRRYGEAVLDVDVAPGAVVPVFYAVPWHQFTRGAIGHEPQKRPGAWLLPTVIGILVAVPLFVAALAAFAG